MSTAAAVSAGIDGRNRHPGTPIRHVSHAHRGFRWQSSLRCVDRLHRRKSTGGRHPDAWPREDGNPRPVAGPRGRHCRSPEAPGDPPLAPQTARRRGPSSLGRSPAPFGFLIEVRRAQLAALDALQRAASAAGCALREPRCGGGFGLKPWSGGVRGFLATVTMRCSGGADLRRRRMRATPDTRSGDYPHLGGTAMKVGRMIRALCCMVLLCAILSGTVHAGEIGDVIHGYRLVPANPAPNTPFELRVVHDNSLALDSNDTTVVIDGNDIDVTAGFIFGSCPPLMPCPPELESVIPIPALPSGAYHMHIVDSD